VGTIVAAVFVLVLVIVFGAYLLLVVGPEQRESGAVRRRLKSSRPKISKPEVREIGKTAERLSAMALLDRILRRWTGVSAPLKELIDQSGMQQSVGSLVLQCIFCTTVTIAVVGLFTSYSFPVLVLGLTAGAAPIVYVRRRARKRLAQFEEQFPEAIDLIARALRAGHALPTALQLASEEVPDPVGGEFRLLFDQQNYGLSMTDALRAFGERVPVLDARFFVTAVQTAREMGGNLSEVLDKLAAVIRERFKVKRQVRAVSAHGRITGVALGLMPPAVALVLYILSPAHIGLLVQDPLGLYMLFAAVTLQIVGVLIIRKIVDVEF
jgi:tight adherence protein B